MVIVKRDLAPMRISYEFYSCKLTDLLLRARMVIKGINTTPEYRELIPLAEELNAVYIAFEPLVLQTLEQGNRSLIPEREVTANLMRRQLFGISLRVSLIANGDPVLLEKSGFKLDKEPQPSPALTAPVIKKFTSKTGFNAINMVIGRVTASTTYYYEIADTTNHTGPYEWLRKEFSKVKFDYANLVPGKRYAMRVGALGKDGTTLWSEVVYLICA